MTPTGTWFSDLIRHVVLHKTETRWNSKDAKRHTKLAHSERAQRQWAKVANNVHQRTGDLTCAVCAANAMVRKTVVADLKGQVRRNPKQRCEFLKQMGYADCRTPKGHQVDHKEALCLAPNKDHPKNMQILSTADHRAKTRQDMSTLKAMRTKAGVKKRAADSKA